MAKNIEIKARVRNLTLLEQKARELSGGPPEIIHQRDVFFPCTHGRLKLRRLSPSLGQLVFYDRPDLAGPKTSDYTVVETNEPANLLDALGRALGTSTQVNKTRRLYMVGRTRVHVDTVENLGDFVELEVVMSPGEALSEGEKEADDLMARLGIRREDLVMGAYADLLEACSSSPLL